MEIGRVRWVADHYLSESIPSVPFACRTGHVIAKPKGIWVCFVGEYPHFVILRGKPNVAYRWGFFGKDPQSPARDHVVIAMLYLPCSKLPFRHLEKPPFAEVNLYFPLQVVNGMDFTQLDIFCDFSRGHIRWRKVLRRRHGSDILSLGRNLMATISQDIPCCPWWFPAIRFNLAFWLFGWFSGWVSIFNPPKVGHF